MSLVIFIVRSASLPISKESKSSNAFLISSGILGSVKFIHIGIPLPAAKSLVFKFSFVIFILYNTSNVFLAPPLHSFEFK
jgi:hypothetical protein